MWKCYPYLFLKKSERNVDYRKMWWNYVQWRDTVWRPRIQISKLTYWQLCDHIHWVSFIFQNFMTYRSGNSCNNSCHFWYKEFPEAVWKLFFVFIISEIFYIFTRKHYLVGNFLRLQSLHYQCKSFPEYFFLELLKILIFRWRRDVFHSALKWPLLNLTWKKTKSDTQDFSNYWPISNLCIFLKTSRTGWFYANAWKPWKKIFFFEKTKAPIAFFFLQKQPC